MSADAWSNEAIWLCPWNHQRRLRTWRRKVNDGIEHQNLNDYCSDYLRKAANCPCIGPDPLAKLEVTSHIWLATLSYTFPLHHQTPAVSIPQHQLLILKSIALYLTSRRNICHGSDSVANAEHEVSLWFPEGVCEWHSHSAAWIYEKA